MLLRTIMDLSVNLEGVQGRGDHDQMVLQIANGVINQALEQMVREEPELFDGDELR